jgi:hypothetical protein
MSEKRTFRSEGSLSLRLIRLRRKWVVSQKSSNRSKRFERLKRLERFEPIPYQRRLVVTELRAAHRAGTASALFPLVL